MVYKWEGFFPQEFTGSNNEYVHYCAFRIEIKTTLESISTDEDLFWCNFFVKAAAPFLSIKR